MQRAATLNRNSNAVFRQTRTATRLTTSVRAARTVQVVRAIQEPIDQTPTKSSTNSSWAESTLDSTLKSVTNVFHRYDFVSAGLGALAVTTFCVARGQDAGTALWITAASTVVALLVNDSLFTDS